MDFIATRLPYRETRSFSKTVLDYIDQSPALQPFYAHPVSKNGVLKAIEARKQFPTNRELLVEELKKQYAAVPAAAKVNEHIEQLLQANTFTITTAHQNNIFTGPLYFIYKIVHAIKLADELRTLLPGNNFVPVYYIGSEDADLDELNNITVGGQKLVWSTQQTGAVGRMKIDKELTKLIASLEGQLSVLPHGNEIISLLKEHYKEGVAVQDATFSFVHHLFAEYGLIVLLPDNAALKATMHDVFKDDLLQQTASGIVQTTAEKLENAGYKVQANPREINLFYLKDSLRERIERMNGEWRIVNTGVKFSETQLLAELENNPERFSPNVILRGLYQETILPNIAFIGGGGETAYWLQLKDLFDHYNIPFPLLVLRNSFLLLENKWQEKIAKLHFSIADFFLNEQDILNKLVARDSRNETKLNGALAELENLYASFKKQASAVDSTLEKHVEALKLKTVSRLQELEKKMLRAEKRKFTDQQRQICSIKSHLFPGDGLQERIDNLSYYYARWGNGFIHELYKHSPALEQVFVILTEKK